MMSLAVALGLRSLDRVQINNQRALDESRLFTDARGPHVLPYWYFQRVVGDKLEVRSPGGQALFVSPLDVCDVIAGTPLLVQAMPQSMFISRSKLPLSERIKQAGPEFFAPAHVLYVQKDRWGVGNVFVWFLDAAFNGDRPWSAPLPDAERRRIAALSRRTVMPVLSCTKASYSADQGTTRSTDYDARVAALFVRAGLRGQKDHVSQLAGVGGSSRRLSLAVLNNTFGPILFRRTSLS